METILLIDGSNLLYRAYYATESKEMKSPEGVDVNAIHTVISLLKKYIDKFKPNYVFIALDEGKETFRHHDYQEYKAHRQETPKRLKDQFSIARELYESMGIVARGNNNYEADDLIATITKLAKDKNIHVQIISSDKDLLQLVDDEVNVFVPKSNKFGKDINYSPNIFEEKFDIKVNQWTIYKSLVGDSSDNIVGVPKIGPKTATNLIKEYGSIDAIVEAAKQGLLKPMINKNILEYEELLYKNLNLVTLVEDIELDFSLEDLTFKNFNQNILTFLHKHGMNRHFSTFQKLLGCNEQEITCDFVEIDGFNQDYIGEENYIYTQTLTDDYFTSKQLGFGIYNEKGLFYLPYDHVNQNFIDFLQDDHKKITYDLKMLMGILRLKKVNNFICDIKIANAVLNPENYKKSLDFLCLEYKVKNIYSYNTIYGSKTNPQYNIEKIKIDICTKTKALKDLFIPIINKLEIENLSDVYYQIEHPLIEVLARMEINGILFDNDKYLDLEAQYNQQINEILDKISQITNININSSKQLSDFIFIENEIDSKGIKKTQNGFSTDQASLNKVLEKLDHNDKMYEFISLVLDYRQKTKIYSTYLIGLNKNVINGYIHPIYHQLLAETGRLSATKPNIQNIPIRTKEGKEIRSLFPAPEHMKFATFDYSQIELRVIAELSQDANMIDIFNKNDDIHKLTAKHIFKIDNVDDEQRRKAKAINFGIIYGIGPHGLAKQIDISLQEAKMIIDNYFKAFPNIEIYQNKLKEDAFKNGFVKTLFDRIRYLNLNINKKSEKEALERIIVNTPVQGTAADIIKKAMIEIDKLILNKYPDVQMVMQIHDELIFYIPETIVEKVSKDIKYIMEHIVNFSVPLLVSEAVANNWEDAK